MTILWIIMSVQKVEVLKPQRNLVVNILKMGIFQVIVNHILQLFFTFFGSFRTN